MNVTAATAAGATPPPAPPAVATSGAGTAAPRPLPGNTIDDVTRAVMRHWKIAALVAAAVTLLAWLAAAVQPKRYRATAIGAVAPLAEQLTNSDVIRGVDTLERRVVIASIAALASAPVTQRASRADDYDIRASVIPNTNLFRIEVEGPDPRRASAVANQVPSLLTTHARMMYRLYGVTLVSAAVPPTKASLPRAGRAAAAGLVLGVLLGIAAAWIFDKRRLV